MLSEDNVYRMMYILGQSATLIPRRFVCSPLKSLSTLHSLHQLYTMDIDKSLEEVGRPASLSRSLTPSRSLPQSQGEGGQTAAARDEERLKAHERVPVLPLHRLPRPLQPTP